MSDRPQRDDAPHTRADEAPLQLSDSSHDSTLPVESGSRPAESSGPESDTQGTRGASPSDGPGGTSGGFETLLGKLVVQAGLVSREDVDLCTEELINASRGDEPRTLTDILLERDFATRYQLDRLKQDFEAKKSGQHIPGFRIKQKLGSGAMATVFLARQLSLDRLVAIKILPKRFSGNVKFIERFYKEGRSAAQLNHPNIVSAYDVGRAGEHHYFVMEYVDGKTIHELIHEKKRIPEAEAVEICRQVAKALQHAHERGFVHRDMKPKNIMITKRGVVKLADLGLARAISDEQAAKAEAGRAYGTPYYISPEQIRGELNIGPAADIYGLGATFYHMVTGRVPFEGKNPSSVMHKHLKNPLEPPDHVNPELSAGCAQIIEMMMAKKPGERYQNATDLLEDLELVAEGQPPHFAHRGLDESAVTEVLTGVAEAPSAPVTIQTNDSPGLVANKPFMIAAIVAAVSVLLNLLLIMMKVAG